MTDQASQPQHLNSAQIQQLEKKLRDAVQAIVKDVALRQWAVEQVLTHCSRHQDFKDLAQMFEETYSFAARPTNHVSMHFAESGPATIASENPDLRPREYVGTIRPSSYAD